MRWPHVTQVDGGGGVVARDGASSGGQGARVAVAARVQPARPGGHRALGLAMGAAPRSPPHARRAHAAPLARCARSLAALSPLSRRSLAALSPLSRRSLAQVAKGRSTSTRRCLSQAVQRLCPCSWEASAICEAKKNCQRFSAWVVERCREPREPSGRVLRVALWNPVFCCSAFHRISDCSAVYTHTVSPLAKSGWWTRRIQADVSSRCWCLALTRTPHHHASCMASSCIMHHAWYHHEMPESLRSSRE